MCFLGIGESKAGEADVGAKKKKKKKSVVGGGGGGDGRGR